ncbi:MAG: hypothetical protein ABJD07_16515 [Gemmatimonadaceae bacterium]
MKRFALVTIFLATTGIAIAYASAFLPGGVPSWAPWLLAACISVAMMALATLGAIGRDGRVGKLAIPIAITLLLMLGGFGVALAFPALGAAEPIVLGLPLRAAAVMYGIGVLPALVLPLAYALTFDTQTLTEDDLERVRAAARVAAELRASRGAT